MKPGDRLIFVPEIAEEDEIAVEVIQRLTSRYRDLRILAEGTAYKYLQWDGEWTAGRRRAYLFPKSRINKGFTSGDVYRAPREDVYANRS